MSMSVGAVGGASAYDPYEMYADRLSGNIGPEDAAEMADAVDFDDSLDNVQNAAGVAEIAQQNDAFPRIEPAEESASSSADHMRGEVSHVMEDMMDIQGSLWGFSARRVLPLAGGTV